MVFLWENVLSLTYNSWCHQKQWVQYFPEQILFGGSRLSGVARQCQTSHISLFAQRHVCGSLVCVFNSCVFSAPQFEFLKIKGLQLFVSEGLRHGKREWRIQTVNLSIFLTAPYLAGHLNTACLEGSGIRASTGLGEQVVQDRGPGPQCCLCNLWQVWAWLRGALGAALGLSF